MATSEDAVKTQLTTVVAIRRAVDMPRRSHVPSHFLGRGKWSLLRDWRDWRAKRDGQEAIGWLDTELNSDARDDDNVDS